MIRKYFRNAGLLAISENLLLIKGLVLIPFLTRQFGPVNYGAWSQISVLITTIFPLVFLGTGTAINRFLPGIDPKKQKQYFSAWMIFLFFMAIVFSLPFFLFGKGLSTVFFGGGDQYLVFMPLAAVWLIVTAGASAAKNWFTVRNSAKWYAVFNVLDDVLYIVAVAAMLVRKEGVYELVIYLLLANLVLLLVEVWVILWKYGLLFPDFSILPALLKFGLPLVPAGFALWVLNYLDRIFLVNYFSLEEVGIYSVAYSLAYQVIPLFARPWRAMFANSAAELYNQEKHDTLQRLFERSAGVAFALSLPAAAGLFLIGRPLLTILAPGFLRGTSILFFVSLGYIFQVLSSYYVIGLGLVHKQYLSIWIYGIAVIVNIVLNFLLIPTWTIFGAAIATCLSFFAMLAFAMYFTAKQGLFKLNITFVNKIVTSTAIMSALVFSTQRIISQVLHSSTLEIVILVSLGLAVYAGCLWMLGVMTRKEISLALSLVRR